MTNIEEAFLFFSRILGQGSRYFWIGTLIVGMDFEGNLLSVEELWERIGEEIGEESLDWGFPKERGEVMLLGSWYSPTGKPLSSSYVKMKCGEVNKTLYVVGPRKWKKSIMGGFRATEPIPISSLKIDYSNAYGGDGYILNPRGKGFVKEDKIYEEIALPLVEDPDFPIVEVEDRPFPAGFGPLPWESLFQRKKEWGTFGKDYEDEVWPNFPEDLKWSLFNRAPEDQQIEKFWSLPISGKIWNMHPEKSEMSFSFPPFILRMLIFNHKREREIFSPHLDTIWLFPTEECGSLIYRTVVPVSDDEASEIKRVKILWDKEEVFLLGEEEKKSENISEKIVSLEENARQKGDVEDYNNEEGMSVSTFVLLDKKDVVRFIEEKRDFFRQRIEDVIFGERDLSGVSFEECVFRKVNFNGTMLENADFSRCVFEEVEFNKVKMQGSIFEQARFNKVSFKDINLDMGVFIGSDFSKVSFESSDLTFCNFSKSFFKDVTFKSVNMEGSDFNGSQIKDAIFENTEALETLFIDGNIDKGEFKGTDFSFSNWVGARISNILFEEAILDNSDFSSCCFEKAIFNLCKINEITMEETEFHKCKFEGGSFNKSSGDRCVLETTSFNNVRMDNICLREARIVACIFKDCSLLKCLFEGSKFENTHIDRADLAGSFLSKTLWEKCRVVESNMFRCDLHKSKFSSSSILFSNLFESNLFKVEVVTTSFEGCNLERTHLKR